jgi:hypothetical protein
LLVTIRPFRDWKTNWAPKRKKASQYRNYLIHEAVPYTVNVQDSRQTLVLGSSASAAGGNWKDAAALCNANRRDWEPLPKVGQELFDDTVKFINLTYERLLASMDGLLTNPAYQQLWGWDNSTPPTVWAAPFVASAPPAGASVTVCTVASTASTTGQSW